MRKTKKDTLREQLLWEVDQWAAHIGVKVRMVSVRKMKRKWASVSTKGYLTLSTELSDIPKPLRDLVIVHELIHLMAPNHSKLFKSYMHTYLPDWEEREKRLHRRSGMVLNGIHNESKAKQLLK